MLPSEYIALPARIGIVAASVACAFGVSADSIRRIAIGDAQATRARTTAMAVCETVFAPGSLRDIAAHFGASSDVILDARIMTDARREFSDEFHQTWRLLLATAMGLLAPPQKPSEESGELSCAA